jgi:hypothetical protein
VTRIGRRTLFAVADLQEFIKNHREAPTQAIEDDCVKPKRGRPSIASLMSRRRL